MASKKPTAVEQRFEAWLEAFSSGGFDRLEEALAELEALKKKAPAKSTALRGRMDLEARVLGEQLRCVSMGEPVPEYDALKRELGGEPAPAARPKKGKPDLGRLRAHRFTYPPRAEWLRSYQEAPAVIARAFATSWRHPEAGVDTPRVESWSPSSEQREHVDLRDVLFFQLYAESKHKDQRPGLVRLLGDWLDSIPVACIHHWATEEERYTWFDGARDNVLSWLSTKREPELTVTGPEVYCASFGVSVVDSDHQHVQLWWPSDFAAKVGVDEFAQRVTAHVESLPEFAWARCGPGLFSDNTTPKEAFDRELMSAAGWEFFREDQSLRADKLPGPSWLTFVGHALAGTDDVARALERLQTEGCEVVALKNGVRIAAPGGPALGPRAAAEHPHARVARALLSVLDLKLTYELKEHFQHEQRAAQWLRRYL